MATSKLMTFYDYYKSPLPAGSYRFVLQQTVKVGDEQDRHYYRDQPFEVQAPRYSIEGGEIQAQFPPPGGVADYQNILPHLVLRARNLPWERSVWEGEGHEPWLALLMISEQETLDGRVVLKTGKVSDLVPKESDAAEWLRVEDGAAILLPRFDRREDPDTPVRLLDLDLRLFRELCPRREDLPLLAHIRSVDTTNKIPLEMVADGEFSVLVANRFPPSGPNTIHLISLEGWQGLLGAPATKSFPASRVRLITLASWSFVSDPVGNDTFGRLMLGLRQNASVFGVALPAPQSDDQVNQALAHGYVPIKYKPTKSTPTFAWYRGPLAPLARKRLKQPPFQRADAALIFDEGTAVMDVSYAAAWQLGRLLALASPAFSKGLRLFVEDCRNAVELAQQIATFLELHRSAFKDLKSNVVPPEIEEVAIADELMQWLARLVLLYPVPFHYLVPHASLLPMESLRFFHLDDNWVDALVDGALSIAVRGLDGKDVAARGDLQSALSRIVYQHRLRLQGRNPDWNPSEHYMNMPKSGFLLRSRLLAGWPGVEITATTSAARDDFLPEILRLDQIADGVLFCLARGSLEKVTFREPREGITFGVDSTGAINTRKSDQTFNVKKDWLRAGARAGVLNLGALGDRLTETEGITVGSAELALRMIRMPEELDMQWG
ncbi:MAG: hypothetical protein WBV94_03350 [Blastocatellia bacterium]